MGELRAFSPHVRWTADEIATLQTLYPVEAWSTILSALPGRTRRQADCKANALGLRRPVVAPRTTDEVRAAKREHMARKRAAEPELARKRQREWVNQNRDRLNAKRREWHESRFFYVRAKRMRGVTAKDLARIWKEQRGICALTGRRLDRAAELDHKLPKCRGGGNELSNLQWVTHEANFAKRDMTVDEFRALCEDCARWIGQRIAIVDTIDRTAMERRA